MVRRILKFQSLEVDGGYDVGQLQHELAAVEQRSQRMTEMIERELAEGQTVETGSLVVVVVDETQSLMVWQCLKLAQQGQTVVDLRFWQTRSERAYFQVTRLSSQSLRILVDNSKYLPCRIHDLHNC